MYYASQGLILGAGTGRKSDHAYRARSVHYVFEHFVVVQVSFSSISQAYPGANLQLAGPVQTT
jgi:hypothetical protein